jgi:hypothetical protein
MFTQYPKKNQPCFNLAQWYGSTVEYGKAQCQRFEQSQSVATMNHTFKYTTLNQQWQSDDLHLSNVNDLWVGLMITPDTKQTAPNKLTDIATNNVATVLRHQ